MSEINYALRKTDLVEFNEYHARTTTKYGSSIMRHQFLYPGIIALMALYMVIYVDDVQKAVVGLSFAFAWSILGPAWIKKRFHEHIESLLTEEALKEAVGQHKLSITEEGLVNRIGKSKTTIAWEDVQRIEKTKEYVFVYMATASALIIPKETVEEREGFGSFFEEMVAAVKATH